MASGRTMNGEWEIDVRLGCPNGSPLSTPQMIDAVSTTDANVNPGNAARLAVDLDESTRVKLCSRFDRRFDAMATVVDDPEATAARWWNLLGIASNPRTIAASILGASDSDSVANPDCIDFDRMIDASIRIAATAGPLVDRIIAAAAIEPRGRRGVRIDGGVNGGVDDQTVGDSDVVDEPIGDAVWRRMASDSIGVDLTDEINQLHRSIETLDAIPRIGAAVRRFYGRQLLLAGVTEIAHDVAPTMTAKHLSVAADASVSAAVHSCYRRLAALHTPPIRPDGGDATMVVIATGELGAGEMSYDSAFDLFFVLDWIDERNYYHRRFFQSWVADVVTVLSGDPSRNDSPIAVDLRVGPKHEVGANISGLFETIRIFESAGRLAERLTMITARPVAGNFDLGRDLIERLTPWIYRAHLRQSESDEASLMAAQLGDVQTETISEVNSVTHTAGGMVPTRQTIRLLQRVYGDAWPVVRVGPTNTAIETLRSVEAFSSDAAAQFARNLSRLWRLRNRRWLVTQVSLPKPSATGDANRQSLAAALGLMPRRRRSDAADRDSVANAAVERFDTLLRQTLRSNQSLIRQTLGDSGSAFGRWSPEVEMVLDPHPDRERSLKILQRYVPDAPEAAFEAIGTLTTESVRFLSSHRCRHRFGTIVVDLLDAVSTTQKPIETLRHLVAITDSIGAKASLWELMARNRATLELMVRLADRSPSMVEILCRHPGMIDELIDSLMLDRLPSWPRLDAQSRELCRSIDPIEPPSESWGILPTLIGFQNAALLSIGVRSLVLNDGRPVESAEAVTAAVGNVWMSIVCRLAEHHAERLGTLMGDPTEMIRVGRRSTASEASPILLRYSDGQTERRIGGSRKTVEHDRWVDALIDHVKRDLDSIDRLSVAFARQHPVPDLAAMAIDDNAEPADRESLKWCCVIDPAAVR